MKKSFLIFSIMGILCTVNGYCGQSAVAVYTCPDECNISDDTKVCHYTNGTDCGTPSKSIYFEAPSDIIPDITQNTMNQVPNIQRKSGANSARAGVRTPASKKIPTVTTQVSNDPYCPQGCSMYCDPSTATNSPSGLSSIKCSCVDPNGDPCPIKY